METIFIEGPYDFDRVLERLSLDPLHRIDFEHRSVKVPLFLNQDHIVAIVTAIGTTSEPGFTIAGITNQNKDLAMKHLKEIFQWDISLKEVHQHFQKTQLRPLFEQHYGTPIVLDFDPFHCLVKCIIHQQLNLTFAHRLTERFVKTFGFEQEGTWFYPQPETIAELQVDQLRELQFSSRKAEYVIGLAREVADGKLHIGQLKHQQDEEVFNQLIKLRGIGPWTVQNFLMFGLGRPNLFPMADIGIQNALKKFFHLEAKPTKEEMEQFSKGWEPYLSYASLYLWRSIE